MDGEWIRWGAGGATAMGLGLFTWAMRAVGKLEIKVKEVEQKDSAERAEIWKRIDQMNDARVTREDIGNLQRSIDNASSQMTHIRQNMTDMAGDIGVLKGRSER